MFNCPQVNAGHARVSILKGTNSAILSVAINSNEWRILKERHWTNLIVERGRENLKGGAKSANRILAPRKETIEYMLTSPC